MNTLELQAKVLQTTLGLPDEKAVVIEQTMRSYTIDILNIAQYLRDKNVDMDTSRGILEGHGITFDGKSKKFK